MESDPVPDPETVREKHKGLLKVSTEELEEAQERFVEKGKREGKILDLIFSEKLAKTNAKEFATFRRGLSKRFES